MDNEQVNHAEEEVKNAPIYKYGDSFKALNVIDVDGEINYLNPVQDDMYFNINIITNDNRRQSIYYDLKGNIINAWSYDNFYQIA